MKMKTKTYRALCERVREFCKRNKIWYHDTRTDNTHFSCGYILSNWTMILTRNEFIRQIKEEIPEIREVYVNLHNIIVHFKTEESTSQSRWKRLMEIKSEMASLHKEMREIMDEEDYVRKNGK